MTDLRVVKPGYALLWPNALVGRDGDRVRLMAGGVVDLDAPCEREWCKDQEDKLGPAPEGAEPTPIVDPRALGLISTASRQPPTPPPAKTNSGADAAAIPTPDEIPEPDAELVGAPSGKRGKRA